MTHRTGNAAPFSVLRVIVCPALIIMLAVPLRGEAEAIDLMRFSRIGDDATIELELTCEMRQEGFRRNAEGTTWTVDIDLGMDCRLPLRNTRNEIHRPPGGRLADLTGIRFDRSGMSSATIELRFRSAVDVTVTQTANRYLLTVDVQKNIVGPVVAAPAPASPTRSATCCGRTTASRSRPGGCWPHPSVPHRTAGETPRGSSTPTRCSGSAATVRCCSSPVR